MYTKFPLVLALITHAFVYVETDHPLHEAILRGDRKEAITLIDNGAELNHLNEDKLSALDLAAGKGYVDVARKLLERGALMKPPGGESILSSPLMRSVVNGHEDVTLELLKNGANVESSDASGEYWHMTPLMAAVYAIRENMVDILLAEGADARVRGPGKRTMLHVVVNVPEDVSDAPKTRRPNTHLTYDRIAALGRIVDKVVAKGADPAGTDVAGRTAIHMAIEKGDRVAFNIFLERIARDMANGGGPWYRVLDVTSVLGYPWPRQRPLLWAVRLGRSDMALAIKALSLKA